MDTTSLQTLVNWIIGAVVVGVISAVSGVIAIIRSGRMMPKELKGADLDNQGKEVSIAGQFDDLATRAAERTLQMQARLSELETNYSALRSKVDVQDVLIGKQTVTIEEQNRRLDSQEIKIKTQDKEIFVLRCELNNSRTYNRALIDQMKAANIVPVDINTLDTEDCTSAGRASEAQAYLDQASLDGATKQQTRNTRKDKSAGMSAGDNAG